MPVVDVHLWSGLRRLTDGAEVVTVEASTIGEMLKALSATHPELKPILDGGVAVAVNGEIYNGALFKPLNEGDEVFLMQKIKGG